MGFIRGVVIKTMISGVLIGGITYCIFSLSFAVAVVVGLSLTVGNLIVTARIVDKLTGDLTGKKSARFWIFIFSTKLLLLAILTAIIISFMQIPAIGFVAGFATFNFGILWEKFGTRYDLRVKDNG
jgi:hypothetical protein